MTNCNSEQNSNQNDLKLGKTIIKTEINSYISILVSAFIKDPVIRWMYPEAEEYLRHFPKFLKAFGGPAFEEGTVLQNDNKSCAIWLAPNSKPDEIILEQVLMTTVSEKKHADLISTLEDMDSAHPSKPHWYLPWLGTDMSAQGQGLGSNLLEKCLQTVDDGGFAAYLETPNPQTIPFYRTHGFEVVGDTQHGSCPVVTFMLRPPMGI